MAVTRRFKKIAFPEFKCYKRSREHSGIGIGCHIDCKCSPSRLDLSWQRLLLHSKISGHFEHLFKSMYDLIELVGTGSRGICVDVLL